MSLKNWDRGLIIHFLFMTIALVLYVGSCAILAYDYDSQMVSVVIYDIERPVLSFWGALFVATMSISAMVFVFILPGLPLARVLRREGTTYLDTLLLSFLLNLGFSFVSGIVLRGVFELTLDRWLVLGTNMTLWSIGFMIMVMKRGQNRAHPGVVNAVFVRAIDGDSRGINSSQRGELLFFFCFVLVISLIVWKKIFVEPFSGDGVESYYFSASLLESVFPYWDLENGFFGFYTGFMITFYPNSQMLALLGPIEAAVRLPYFVYLFFVIALSNEILRCFSSFGSSVRLALLALTAAYSVLVNMSYSTYSFIVDIAEPLTTDMAFLFFLSAGLLYSLRGWWWRAVVFFYCMTHCLVSGNGLVIIVLVSMFLLYRPRMQILGMFIVMVLLILLIGYIAPFFGGFTSEGVSSPAMIINQLLSGDVGHIGDNLGKIARTVGIIPLVLPLIVGWSMLRRRKKLGDWWRVSIIISMISLWYALILVISPKMHLHYLLPLQFLFPLAAFISLEGLGSEWGRRVVLSLHVLLMILFFVFAIPGVYPLDHGPRNLGKVTIFNVDDDHAATECSTLLNKIADESGTWFPASPWKSLKEQRYFIGHHTLLYYSQRYGAANPAPLLFFGDRNGIGCGTQRELVRTEIYCLCTTRRKRLQELSKQPNPLIVPGWLFHDIQFGR